MIYTSDDFFLISDDVKTDVLAMMSDGLYCFWTDGLLA